MLRVDCPFDDGVLLADSVRALAIQARQILRHPADSSESRALLMAIDHLEAEARDRSSDDLIRWLVSLRKRIEGHALAMV